MIAEDLLKSLVGMQEKTAEEAVSAKNINFRITRRDDEVFMGDMMFDENRIKVEIEKGLVLKASIG